MHSATIPLLLPTLPPFFFASEQNPKLHLQPKSRTLISLFHRRRRRRQWMLVVLLLPLRRNLKSLKDLNLLVGLQKPELLLRSVSASRNSTCFAFFDLMF
ncbi:hypothetical protein ACP275_14G090700 [Erythranthe tilingii]